jgi:Rha family phage regulatory protein
MNNLSIINLNGQFTVDSREVAEMTEVRHSDLLEKIGSYLQVLQNGEFRSLDFFIPSSYSVEGQQRLYPCYLLTRKGCDMVANKMTGEKGVLFTAAYVTKFEEMERQQKPLQIDSKFLFQIAAQLEEKEQQILLMKPKAEFFDAVADSKTAIEMSQAAKVLNYGKGRNTLFAILRAEKILMDNNEPYQEFIDRGYFRSVEQKYTKPDGTTCISIKTLVYQKGLDYIKKILDRQKALPA